MILEALVRVSVLLGLCILCVQTSTLPDYLKPCSLSDSKLDECCLEHGRQALPTLVKGDKSYNIPSLSPLFLPKLSMDATQNLHITMTGINAYGLEKTDLEQVRFDVKNQNVTVKLMIDNLQLVGVYEMKGKILVLPIEGKGDFNITAIGGEYRYNFEYILEEKENGKHYISIKDNDKLEFELQKAMIYLDNLFNGNELLGKNMNTFLNENWRDVLGEIGVTVSETVRSVAKAIMTGYLSKIAYEDLFLK